MFNNLKNRVKDLEYELNDLKVTIKEIGKILDESKLTNLEKTLWSDYNAPFSSSYFKYNVKYLFPEFMEKVAALYNYLDIESVKIPSEPEKIIIKKKIKPVK